MAPNPFSDRPGGDYEVEGRVLNWSGDDNSSRSIGLFKFKLGLFEFVLPTWSLMDEQEDKIINANRLRLSVPNPTRRKEKDEKAIRNKTKNDRGGSLHTTHAKSHNIDQSSQHSQKMYKISEEEKLSVTVAYIIIIPNVPGHRQIHDAIEHHDEYRPNFDGDNINNNSNEDHRGSSRKRRQFRAMQAFSFAKSIEVAHVESKYGYRLYALGLGSLTLSSLSEFSKLGIETIVIDEADLNGINSVADMKTEPTSTVVVNRRLDKVELNEDDTQEEGRKGLLGILNQHDIIIQLNLDSFIVNSMDDVFDAMMGVGHWSNIVGVVESHSDVDGGKKEEGVVERLELINSATDNDSNLFIFKSTSQREQKSFLNWLSCHLSKKQQKTPVADKGSSMSADCSMRLANEEGSLLLDRCIYDVGVFDGRNCLHNLTLDNIRVARFSGILVEPHSNDIINVDHEEEGKAPSCRTPWEYRSEVKCSNDHVGHVNEKICSFLCRRWFQLVDISK